MHSRRRAATGYVTQELVHQACMLSGRVLALGRRVKATRGGGARAVLSNAETCREERGHAREPDGGWTRRDHELFSAAFRSPVGVRAACSLAPQPPPQHLNEVSSQSAACSLLASSHNRR